MGKKPMHLAIAGLEGSVRVVGINNTISDFFMDTLWEWYLLHILRWAKIRLIFTFFFFSWLSEQLLAHINKIGLSYLIAAPGFLQGFRK